MPMRSTKKHHIKKVLKLYSSTSLSLRDIHRVRRLPKSTISDDVERFKDSGLGGQTDTEIYQRLFSLAPTSHGKIKPDFSHIHSQLKRKGVTRQLLWTE